MLYIILLILSIITLVYSILFREDLFGVGCSLFTMYDRMVNGENITDNSLSKWTGFASSQIVLKQTVEAAALISAISFGEFILENDVNSLKADLNDEYENKKDTTVTNHDPLNQTEIIPYFIEQYGPITDNTTYLGMINYELNTKIYNDLELLNDYRKLIEENISENYTEIAKAVAGAIYILNNIEEYLDYYANQFLDEILYYIKNVDKYLLISIYIVISLLIFGCVSGFAFILIFLISNTGIKNYLTFRKLFISVWCLIFILSVCNIIIGVALGIISDISKDGVGLINYMFSIDNLNSTEPIIVNISTNGTAFLDVCTNRNGDLSSVLNISVTNSPIESINTLYSYKHQIEVLYNKTQGYNDYFDSTYNLNLLYKEYINEKIYDDIAPSLIELNKYTDSSLGNSYIDNSSSNIRDRWVSLIKDCPNGYNYVPIGDPQLQLKGNYCLLVSEWSGHSLSITSRYSMISTPLGYYKTADKAVYADTSSIASYIDDSLKVLYSMKAMNTEFDLKSTKLMIKYKISVGIIYQALKTLDDIYSPLISEGESLMTILGCGIFKKYLNIVYDQLDNELGDSAKVLYSLTLSIGVIQLVASIMMYIGIVKMEKLSEKIKKIEMIERRKNNSSDNNQI